MHVFKPQNKYKNNYQETFENTLISLARSKSHEQEKHERKFYLEGRNIFTPADLDKSFIAFSTKG